MHIVMAAVVSLAAGFALGIIFHKQLVSEAEQITSKVKLHVSSELVNLETRLKGAIERLGQKL